MRSRTRAETVRRLRAAGCVFAEDEAEVLLSAAGTPAHLSAMVDRRAAGEPLEYVVGWADFCGVRVAVEPGVFVPRPRTALLVREAVARTVPGSVVLDLCCGCGALGAAVAEAVPGIGLHAADVDPVAVGCARRNVERYGGTVHCGDLFAPLPGTLRGRVDVLLANVPYVPTDELALLPAEARLFEPRTALDGGADGLDVLRRVAARAPDWLAPGGYLLTEASGRQAPVAARILAAQGFEATIARDEELDATAVIATAVTTPGPGRTRR